jgi:hypothetical protein
LSLLTETGHGTFSIADWRRVLLGIAVLMAAGAGAALVVDLPGFAFTGVLFRTQDIPVVAAVVILLALLSLTTQAPFARLGVGEIRNTGALLALATLIVAFAGTFFVFSDFALSRDEAMAVFDSHIVAAGRLVAPIAPSWRSLADALEPEFLFRIAQREAWASLYLPGGAALRALVGAATMPELTNPLLAALAVVSTFGCARLLWPERRDAAVLATVLVATSPQMLITAMTPYAMTAHLALNTLWLFLFLKDRGWTHAAAIAVGWLATGLHQFIFHPLFIAPFIVALLLRRRYGLATVYAGSYVAIALFWISYRPMLLALYGLQAAPADAGGASGLIATIASLLAGFSLTNLHTMAKNLLRFATWQTPILAPLCVVALIRWRILATPLRCVAAGFVLTITAMTLLLAYQGHGWGYRYLHGFIGGLGLLAAAGWVAATSGEDAPAARAMRAAIVWSTLFAVCLLIPARALQAHRFAEPYAKAWRQIAATPADLVFIDQSGVLFGIDLVRNDPFLRNRPKTLLLDALSESQIDTLCVAYSVALFGKQDAAAAGIETFDDSSAISERTQRLRAHMRARNCGAGPQ